MTIGEMLNAASLVLGMIMLLVMATLPLFSDGGGLPRGALHQRPKAT